MASHFISSRAVVPVITAAVAKGVDADALLADASLRREEIEDVDCLLPIEKYFSLLTLIRERIADPSFPFFVAESWGREANLLRLICRSCANLGAGMQRAGRFIELITSAVSLPLEMGPETTVMWMARHVAPGPVALRLADEIALAELLTRIRELTGAPIVPSRIHFAFPEPPDTTPHRAFFDCELRFGQPRSEIHLPTATMALPLVQADPNTLAFFESYLQKVLATDRGPRTTTEDVRRAVVKAMRGRTPTIDEVASSLGLSGRTLRRRLQSEGSSFQKLVDESRFELAKESIRGGTSSFSMIAFMLGFSETSAFHRAFRRWAGITAQAYARAVRSGSGSYPIVVPSTRDRKHQA